MSGGQRGPGEPLKYLRTYRLRTEQILMQLITPSKEFAPLFATHFAPGTKGKRKCLRIRRKPARPRNLLDFSSGRD